MCSFLKWDILGFFRKKSYNVKNIFKSITDCVKSFGRSDHMTTGYIWKICLMSLLTRGFFLIQDFHCLFLDVVKSQLQIPFIWKSLYKGKQINILWSFNLSYLYQ